jgi:hypothetical protein
MKRMHSFRFADADLNEKLIALLKKRANGKFSVDAKRVVHYSHEHEDLIGNELICAIRAGAFSSWQIVSFPVGWTDSYKHYMTEHGVPFREELRDNELRFLIPRSFRPHSWKLEEPRAKSLPLKAVS